MLFDFFILFAPPDRSVAYALRAALEARHSATCFLHTASDEPWSQRLKRAMSDSTLAVALISPQMVAQYLDEADLRVVLQLASMGPEAHRVVAVLVNDAHDNDVPPALSSLTALEAPGVSLDPVAQALALELQSPPRSPQIAFVRTHELMDAVWARVEPAFTGGPAHASTQHGMRVRLDGADIVGGYQRITASEFDQKLTPARLDHIRRLEKSMELNLAAWEDASRHRAPTASDQEVADRAITAMGEDLDLVLYLLEQSGFFLDDHYLRVRDVLRRHWGRHAPRRRGGDDADPLERSAWVRPAKIVLGEPSTWRDRSADERRGCSPPGHERAPRATRNTGLLTALRAAGSGARPRRPPGVE